MYVPQPCRTLVLSTNNITTVTTGDDIYDGQDAWDFIRLFDSRKPRILDKYGFATQCALEYNFLVGDSTPESDEVDMWDFSLRS